MWEQLAQLVVNGLITGSILSLTGVGATLVFGVQRVPNFAHGDYLTIGAYVGFYINVILNQSLLLAAASSLVSVACLAVVIHLGLLRPLRGRGTVAISIITVGLGIMMRNSISLMFGAQNRIYAVNQSEVVTFGFIRLSPGQTMQVAVALSVAPLVAVFLARTRVGKSMRAVADNRILASISGVDIERIGLYVWILAGSMAGLGGFMLALGQGPFGPGLGAAPLFLIFTTVILGGLGSAYGALAGGLLLGLAMEVATWDGLAGGIDSKYKPAFAFLFLILLLMFRPRGLFGRSVVL